MNLGSVSEGCAVKAKCTVIIVKDILRQEGSGLAYN